ncbi:MULTISPECIES: ribosome silencing factor [Pedobacter]|uniref:Ribosomal silencing factor RsfS n=1 Tax=Pedobacter heparinus (strain ATCC 13125 / DSM 2366 / CIP 104194 / JCM 7457 / NBRC 12017 / NCIMB 9290 / NRRL B-14731 / HIM 762-3) TaxID=485917 RepID=C6XXK3_PEDHD|nr:MULTISPECIES: ribosome silencing factor [Pedobacter]ACU02257.1 iojap-like protein [Pedobacter heparinus DSM 2366]MBB5437120.1 ribosome-associated protein [Pedobacter sp. AK017]
MVKKKIGNLSTYLSEIAVHGIQEKKGNDIVRLDLRALNSSVSDYFIICNADSATQVKAIADSVEEEIYKKTQTNPWRKEGLEHADWIILDYFDIVVHIFKTEKREFYGIEDLWGDAQSTSYQSA